MRACVRECVRACVRACVSECVCGGGDFCPVFEDFLCDTTALVILFQSLQLCHVPNIH